MSSFPRERRSNRLRRTTIASIALCAGLLPSAASAAPVVRSVLEIPSAETPLFIGKAPKGVLVGTTKTQAAVVRSFDATGTSRTLATVDYEAYARCHGCYPEPVEMTTWTSFVLGRQPRTGWIGSAYPTDGTPGGTATSPATLEGGTGGVAFGDQLFWSDREGKVIASGRTGVTTTYAAPTDSTGVTLVPCAGAIYAHKDPASADAMLRRLSGTTWVDPFPNKRANVFALVCARDELLVQTYTETPDGAMTNVADVKIAAGAAPVTLRAPTRASSIIGSAGGKYLRFNVSSSSGPAELAVVTETDEKSLKTWGQNHFGVHSYGTLTTATKFYFMEWPGTGLWVTDGTVAGTSQLLSEGFLNPLGEFAGFAVFELQESGTHPRSVVYTDGTVAGTKTIPIEGSMLCDGSVYSAGPGYSASKRLVAEGSRIWFVERRFPAGATCNFSSIRSTLKYLEFDPNAPPPGSGNGNGGDKGNEGSSGGGGDATGAGDGAEGDGAGGDAPSSGQNAGESGCHMGVARHSSGIAGTLAVLAFAIVAARRRRPSGS